MSVAVPFLDLQVAQEPLLPELDAVWREVTRTARFVGGPAVEGFESAWAGACGVPHAVGVANGTDAIELTLRALGVGPGDEVVVPANTFIATAEAVLAVGARPRFVDVDPGTLLVTADSVAAGLTPATAAVVVVHLYGQAADVAGIARVAAAAGVALVEDCAQAHGALWRGQPVGSFGAAGCWSFYPGKNLGAFGDGGAVTTTDAALAERIRQVADHGRAAGSKYEHPVVGRNSRLDALQAAVLSVKLPHLPGWNDQRRAAADRYRRALADVDGVRLTDDDERSTSVHHLQVVRVPDRERVRAALAAAGVQTGVHYPVPCHRQRDYRHLPHGDPTVCEEAAPALLSLPVFPGITPVQVDRVCEALQHALAGGRALVR